jgi:hypothetical protein
MECTLEANAKGCTCTYAACPHHGRCCACVANHRRKGEVPGCLFSREGEARWDRSRAAFLRDQGQ